MFKISIVVPVYNCREYLERCVNSILAQTYTELQLILVDDGSTDGSGAICDALGSEDDRVLVIHQKNAGVSAARNAGLDVTTGDYVGFVDADDYIAENTYETALDAGGDCDIVMWDTVSIWDNGRTAEDTIPLLSGDRVLSKTDLVPALLVQMAGSACRCLYRAELVKDIRFPVGIKLSEDRLFNLAAMGKAQRLSYLKRGLYFRYMRPGSAVNRYHGDIFEKNLIAMEVAQSIIRKYWDESYLGVYTRMFVISGALLAIYEICSRDFPGGSRLVAIRKITGHKALKEAFALCPAQGLREKLLNKRMNIVLLLIGTVWNIKNWR